MRTAFLFGFFLLGPAVLAHDPHEHIGGNQQLVLSLSESSTADSILANHDKVDEENAHVKQFQGDTLAYVTPWNNRGYDVVKEFKGKFDYVSPVWYYIERRGAEDDYEFFGDHDVDHGWMDQVRGEINGRAVGKIVPRFQFRNWNLQDYQAFASNNAKEGHVLAERIMEYVLEHDFDGIVLECGYPTLFPHFIKNLALALHHGDKELIVVIPPIRTDEHKQMMDADMFEMLAQVIDKFSIMTYDYSSHLPTGGPNAPIDWIMDNIEWLTNDDNAHKLLVGLNMYAMAYHTEGAAMPEAMLLRDVLAKLPGAELVWDKESEEHWFISPKTHTRKIWLPTRKSIKNRIHIAEDYGVGLSLWEVGQGLDYWYDLF